MTSDNMVMQLGVLKIKSLKAIFHEAGAKRITRKAINALDEAVAVMIKSLAEDVIKVYPESMIETNDIARVCNLTQKYKIVMEVKQVDDIDINKIVREEPLPEGFEDVDDE